MNMRAVFLHVLADALGSVIVVFSALVNIYQKQLRIPRSVISFIDPSLCLVLVILILCSTLPLCKFIFKILNKRKKFYLKLFFNLKSRKIIIYN